MPVFAVPSARSIAAPSVFTDPSVPSCFSETVLPCGRSGEVCSLMLFSHNTLNSVTNIFVLSFSKFSYVEL